MLIFIAIKNLQGQFFEYMQTLWLKYFRFPLTYICYAFLYLFIVLEPQLSAGIQY